MKAAERPALVMDDSTHCYIIMGDDVIDCGHPGFSHGLYMLMALYYVLDLNYPKSFSNALVFIQMKVFKDTKNGFDHSSKFSKFMADF